MKIRSVFLILILFFAHVSHSRITAQKSESVRIEWQDEATPAQSSESISPALNFKGAVFNGEFLPVFVKTIELPAAAGKIIPVISNVVTAPLNHPGQIQYPDRVSNDFDLSGTVVWRKKKPFACLSVVTVRKSKINGYEKLVSFDLSYTASGVAERSSARIHAAESVLANGVFYRIGIVQNGVYKITYQQLKNAGFDVDNTDPRNIRLYGNGGGMLPQANSTPRFDDLQENSIIVNGENDGIFDPSDYILFYGTGQVQWTYSGTPGIYSHQNNLYADTTYYFITADHGTGKRIQTRNSSALTPNFNVNSYDDYQTHELDQTNLLKSGREWYGESIDLLNTSRTFNFIFPNLVPADTTRIVLNLIGRATFSNNHNSNNLSFTCNGNSLGSQSFYDVGTSPQDNYAVPVVFSKVFQPGTSGINIAVTLASTDPNATAWLKYIEINTRRFLDLSGSAPQIEFRDSRSAGTGNISQFRINNANSGNIVWDITDPLNPLIQNSQLNSNELTFTVETGILRTFTVFNGNSYYTPVISGPVENQNLHGLSNASLIIVTNPYFLADANRLADFHKNHDGFSTHVVTTTQVYNEFSSGSQDVSAIRDFMKMFYDRATSPAELPRYLCIMGDASYDNKYRISGNTNMVVSYQSPGSLNQTQTYMSDDYFGLLDDSEGNWTNSEIVDLSVGRIPVKSTTEASQMVDKIIHYGGGDLSGQVSAPSVLGDWRNSVTFVGDDQDSNTHFKQADTLANRVNNGFPLYNVDKIYLDAYNQETTPGGQRYPDARQAIVDKVQRGTLLMTYIGHGGEVGWAHERILEVSDINGWSNWNAMPAFLTATCEFTRVDDPGRTSAGELVFLNPRGGGICLFTTSRLAFSSSNYNLCQRFFTHIFSPLDNRMPTIGEIFEQTKIDVYSDQYVRNFLLIGDPALTLSYPKFTVRTNSINGVSVSSPTDTLKALSKITVTGEIQDAGGNRLSSFNGILNPTVFDKFVTYYTLGNDRFVTNDPSFAAPFNLQKNVIYRGKVSVTNGEFSFSFVVPKDIQFAYGLGKLSYYAQNGATDASGYYNQVVVGGFNQNASEDRSGPMVKLYINDEKFVRGGITDPNPVLYAVISDSSGINTVGTGIGHDMTAELDNNNKIFVLNNYFENDLNSYQDGKVHYPLKDLAAGPHTASFKVWDVYNNSGEATTDFVVAETADLALDHVLNYPNPFTTHTTFMFEHNRPYSNLDVQVQVFTVSGKLVKTISGKIFSTGYRSDDLEWDGLDDYGDKIGRGVYIYKLKVRASDGSYADKFEKLVILR
ncbi:MAG: type IX secretion system sortase PorU [Bacteroidia bacterium]|nr:type IX secretion system sortase PorU [Bacteroidia bacterium]